MHSSKTVHCPHALALAFAGTDDPEDILTDIWQGLGRFTESYAFAMDIAWELNRIPEISRSLITTGHSLGGGLASAASVTAGIRADTFNAAGLLRDTLLLRDLNGDLLEPEQEIYPGSLNRYDTMAGTLIEAYYLDWDILSFFQDNVNITPELMQDAIGERRIMDGPLDFEIGWSAAVLTTQLLSGAGIATIIFNMGLAGYYMGLAHTTEYYHYGVLVDEATGWDIHGYDL